MRPWSWGMQEPSDILLLQSDCLVPPVKIAVFCYDCWNSCDGCSITSAVLVTVTIAIITTTISIAIVASVVFMYVCSPPRPPPSSSSVLPSSSALFTGFLKFVFGFRQCASVRLKLTVYRSTKPVRYSVLGLCSADNCLLRWFKMLPRAHACESDSWRPQPK